MLGTRSDEDFLNGELISKTKPISTKKEFIKKYMLDPEENTSLDSFILRYYVDYEYPDSQGYLKSYWKNLMIKTLSNYYDSVSRNYYFI
jgi:hypothetical protein